MFVRVDIALLIMCYMHCSVYCRTARKSEVTSCILDAEVVAYDR